MSSVEDVRSKFAKYLKYPNNGLPSVEFTYEGRAVIYKIDADPETLEPHIQPWFSYATSPDKLDPIEQVFMRNFYNFERREIAPVKEGARTFEITLKVLKNRPLRVSVFPPKAAKDGDKDKSKDKTKKKKKAKSKKPKVKVDVPMQVPGKPTGTHRWNSFRGFVVDMEKKASPDAFKGAYLYGTFRKDKDTVEESFESLEADRSIMRDISAADYIEMGRLALSS